MRTTASEYHQLSIKTVKVDIEAKEEGGIKDKIIVIAESALFLLLVEKVY